MKSKEEKILEQSDLFFYNPSSLTKELFLYPLVLGEFYYDNDYYLYRENYDSFLLMYITKGSCIVSVNGTNHKLNAGEAALIDCYKPHSYYSEDRWSALWIHFDGPMARKQFDVLNKAYGTVIKPRNPQNVLYTLQKMVNIFRENASIRDSSFSKYITNILTELFLSGETKRLRSEITDSLDKVVLYINDNFDKDITIDDLANLVNLSKYYFIRVFKEQTGFTPHQFIINLRINHAKYLLKSTTKSVKEIGFTCGFSSESIFCTTFKKRENTTPSEYRMIDPN